MTSNDSLVNTSALGVSSGEGDSIKVFVRVRPPMNDTDHAMCLETDCNRNAVIMQSKPDPKVFTFDHVADMYVTQETVFTSVGRKIIESCIGGYNGTIFAYGQTGSGKTFTMLGPSENSDNFQHELRGVIPRSFEYLFTLVKREKELRGEKVQFLTKCSFLEIYNEQIFDLLDEASNGLHLRENIKKGVFVDGLIEHAVNNASEAYDVLSTGWMNRTVASTSMNRESSRSHAVFTLSIESKTLNNGVWTMKASQLNLVDLAGSERQKDTHTTGARLKEAGSINKSLSVLGNVIMSLVDIAHGKTRHVPYRDSKLSFLLRDSLGGNAKTCIIACIHPGAKSFGETLSTLQFARRAKMIKNKAVINEDAQGSVTHLQAEIKRLKETLQQYQAGTLSVDVVTPATLSIETGESDKNSSHWKRNFLQAMQFRELTKQEIQSAEDKCLVIQGKLEKMDKQLRSKDMVLKFRANSLKVYENSKKEKRDLYPDEKDVIIENLQGQIAQLQTQVVHHPELGRYKLENDRLRAENCQLRNARKSSNDMDRERAVELEKHFQELLNEKLREGTPIANLCTPQDGGEKIATATLERHKAQVESLQIQLEQLQNELQSEKESREKETIKLKSDLDSWKTRYDEVAAVQKSQCISGQIEREERDRLHIETIRNLTPKKVQYSLRNRTILAGASSLSFCLDDSGEGGDILSEEKPVDMYETLEEELKKIREENTQLHTKVEEKDSLIVDKLSEISRLGSENTQLTSILEKEREEWGCNLKNYKEQIQSYNKQIIKFQDENQELQETKIDLNVIMDGLDRKVKELKKEKENAVKQKETTLAELSTKVMQLENEKIKLVSDLSVAVQECEKLKESEDTAQATVFFIQDQVTDAENKLADREAELSKLRHLYQDSLDKAARQEAKSTQLVTELQLAGDKAGDKEKELLTVMAKKKGVEHQYEELSEELSEIKNKLKTIEDELLTEKDNTTRLTKLEKENKEVYQIMCNKLENQKQECEESKQTLIALDEQLRESKEREDLLQKTVENKETMIETLVQTVSEKENVIAELEIENQKKKAELDNQQEDLDSALEEIDKTKIDVQTLEGEKESLVKALKERENTYECLKKDFDVKTIEWELQNSDIKQLQVDKEHLCEKVRKTELEYQQLNSDLSTLRSDSSSHITSLKTTQQELGEKETKLVETETQLEEFSEKIFQYTQEVAEKQDYIETMQLQMTEDKRAAEQKQSMLEASRKAQEILQLELKDLRSKFQNTIEDRDTKAKEVEGLIVKLASITDIENKLELALNRADEAEQRKDHLETKTNELLSSLNASETKMKNMQGQYNLLQENSKDSANKVQEAEVECNRLRGVLEEKSKDVDFGQSEINQLKEQYLKVQKRNEELSDECAKLGSHSNHLQKISLLAKKNQEHNQLLEPKVLLHPANNLQQKHNRLNSTPIQMNRKTLIHAPDVSDILRFPQNPIVQKFKALHGYQQFNTTNETYFPENDQDTEFETYGAIAFNYNTRPDTQYESMISESNEEGVTTETYHSLASGELKYSAQDIVQVIGDPSPYQSLQSSASTYHIVNTKNSSKDSTTACSDSNMFHSNDSKHQPEVFRSVENDTASMISPHSFFSVEESALVQTQSHLMLDSEVFESERIPYSTPKTCDDFAFTSASKDISGSFIDIDNVVGYNVPSGKILTPKSNHSSKENNFENNSGDLVELSSEEMEKSTVKRRKGLEVGWFFNSPIERCQSEPETLSSTPPKRKYRKSLSKVELFELVTKMNKSEPNCSQIVDALDIKVDPFMMQGMRDHVQSEQMNLNFTEFESIFQGGAVCVPVVPCSRQKFNAPSHLKSRGSFTSSFRKRTAKFRQSIRKSLMKRSRGSRSGSTSSADFPLQSRETEV